MGTESSIKGGVVRPLSPHLGIYRPQITSVLSILHRITGVVTCGGLLLASLYIISAAYFPEKMLCMSTCTGSITGQIALFGFVFSLYFHVCTGLRHLAWDMGKGFEIHTAYRTGYTAVAAAVLLTLITWYIKG